MASEIAELIGFLGDVKAEVRLIAASHLLTLDLASTPENLLGEMTESLSRRLAGSYDFTKVALSILVNVSDIEIVSDRMLERKTMSSVYALVTDSETPGDVVELAGMLLCNMTRQPRSVMQLLEVESDFVGRRFLALCGKLLSSKEPTEPGARDAIGWLAVVVQNCSQLEDARRFLLDKNRSIMAHLSQALLKFKTAQRRRGVAGTIRNCLLDTAHHTWLVEPPVNLIQSVLICLVSGKGAFDDDEKRAMPIEVREASFDLNHTPDSDAQTRAFVTESLCLLCTHGIIAERIKLWSGYPIIRELERFEKDEEVQSHIFSAVDLLVREHDDFLIHKKAVKGSTLSEREKELNENQKTPADLQREILALTEEERALTQCCKCGGKGSDAEPLMRCTGCYSIAFCSKKCQVAKWKEHKTKCLEIQQRNQEDDDKVQS